MREAREKSAQQKPDEKERMEAELEKETSPAEETESSVEKGEMTAEQEMVLMQKEVEEANDMMLRLAAEMDNYKKRSARDRESLIKYASQGIVQALLPVLDNFERAMEFANKSRDFDSFLEGVEMIYKQMYEALERNSITRIDAVGKAFDPNIHEAVMQVASEEYPENVVVEELQKGYMLHDRVIRPSMVSVSKGSEE